MKYGEQHFHVFPDNRDYAKAMPHSAIWLALAVRFPRFNGYALDFGILCRVSKYNLLCVVNIAFTESISYALLILSTRLHRKGNQGVTFLFRGWIALSKPYSGVAWKHDGSIGHSITFGLCGFQAPTSLGVLQGVETGFCSVVLIHTVSFASIVTYFKHSQLIIAKRVDLRTQTL